MRPLRYSINVSLDGCCGHEAFRPDEQVHQHFADSIARADALVYGRLTYELMEVWRVPDDGAWPDWIDPSMHGFARTIDAARKYVVSSTLDDPGWNTEVIDPADLETTVLDLKGQAGNGLLVGGMRLPLALAELGLIDELELVVHPVVVGHGPWLLDGLSTPLELQPIDRVEFSGGAVAVTYQPVRTAG